VGACTAVRIETVKELSISGFICLSYSFFLVSVGTAVLLNRIRNESFQFFYTMYCHCPYGTATMTTTTTIIINIYLMECAGFI